MDENLHYNPQKLLSYNRIMNFIIGARGLGKTFGMKAYAINRFLKKGEQFVYVKRHKTDLKRVDNYFDDIMYENKFSGVEFEAKGKEFKINGHVAGWAIPLSTWQKEKSNAYPHVSTVIFDEFVREKDTSSYLPNEVEALLNLLDTIFRDRTNVRCFCLSNSVSLVNPYFIYFDLIPNTNKRYNAYKDIVVEIPDSIEFANERRKTPFGSLISGTEYGNMSLENEFVNDSEVFIEKRSKQSKFKFAFLYNDMRMGVWVDVNEGLMYVSQDYDPDTRWLYAMTKHDQNENSMLMSQWKQNYHLAKLISAFKNGFLRFDNAVIRNLCYEMFNKMNIH